MNSIVHSAIHEVAKNKPREKAATFQPMSKYMMEKIAEARIRLGTGGINNLSLSLGYSWWLP